MIVRPTPDGVQLITQPDHAHLAGAIMSHCVALASRPRRSSILHAIHEHDNGWIEEDAAPAVHRDSGEVVDFVSAPADVRHRVWPRAVARLVGNDPWAAALVAQHAVTVYDRFRQDEEWTAFFSRMEAVRDEAIAASGTAAGELAGDYAFVRLGDLISLVFCTGWEEEQRFDVWTVRRSSDRILVAPDPFGGVEIPVRIDARLLARARFRTKVALRSAVRAAPQVTIHGRVAGVSNGTLR